MSLGFGVGDFIAVIQLANKVRRDFAGAPSEFKGALEVVGNLSIVLQRADVAASDQDLSRQDETDLQTIHDSCQNILHELEQTLGKYSELKSQPAGFRGKLKRAWKQLSLEPEDIRILRSRVNDNIALLNAFTLRQTRDDTAKLVRYQETQERRTISLEEKAILDWLTPIDYFPQQNDYLTQRQAGTGQWLLDSAEYRSWTENGKQTLFCPGIPGAGKTILSSIVVDDLSRRFQSDTSVVVVYLYCNFKRQMEQTLVDLLASLLKQLAESRPSLPETVKSLYKRKTRLSADEILTALHSVAAEYSRIFVVIDALDECQVRDGCRAQLPSKLADLQAKHTGKVNIFATSRFIPEITEKFSRDPLLEIRANDQDIQRYIDGRISHLPSFVQINPDLQQEIKTEIVKVVDGMFLLAQLYLDSLIGKKSVKATRTALKKLPSGSDAYYYAYDAAMERIEGQIADQRDLAKQVLSWITCAKRPLTTVELQHALAVEVDEEELDEDNISPIEDMISVCAGLVAVDTESHIIRLVHYTTQEYFERTQERWFPNAEADITTTCVTYLSFTVFESGYCTTYSSFKERHSLHPLYDYSARNWGHHARQSSRQTARVPKFLQCVKKSEAAAQALMTNTSVLSYFNYLQSFPRQVSGLHLAAYFGATQLVLTLLQDTEADSKNSLGQTPLSYAAMNGQAAVVELLLATGKVEADSKDRDERTSLSHAASNGHIAVIRLLLEAKADVDQKDAYNYTPLWGAAENGHEAVVSLLLRAKADVDLKNSQGRTALMQAAENGHEAIISLLLRAKADVDLKDIYGHTPLIEAAENGHEAVVSLLLGVKADVDLKDIYGHTPLIGAAENGYDAVVSLLLRAKADVDLKDIYGHTPLMGAAENGHEAVVSLLLATGKVDVNSRNGKGQTPLSLAVESGHEAVIKLLLDTDKVDLDSRDNLGRTPLWYATACKHEAVVKLLKLAANS